MARQAATTRKAAAVKAAPVSRPNKAATVKFDALSADQKIAQLLAERDALRTRVGDLEADLKRHRAKQAQAADRVAWALDSLRDVLGERG